MFCPICDSEASVLEPTEGALVCVASAHWPWLAVLVERGTDAEDLGLFIIDRGTESARVVAGREGKLGGHRFEVAVAESYGLDPVAVRGDSGTKVDVQFPLAGVSLKNPSGNSCHTALYTLRTIVDHFQPPEEVRAFLELFVGVAGETEDEFLGRVHGLGIRLEDLDPDSEVTRHRVLAHNIPANLRDTALLWFNQSKLDLFDAVLASGINQADNVRFVGWAWEKDAVGSLRWFDLDTLRSIAARGVWEVAPSGSTLVFAVDGTKLFHLQMKGSGGDPTSAAYHGLLFHLHRGGLSPAARVSDSDFARRVGLAESLPK